MEIQGRRLVLTFVHLSLVRVRVRAEGIETEGVLNLLHHLTSLSVIRPHHGKERPQDIL